MRFGGRTSHIFGVTLMILTACGDDAPTVDGGTPPEDSGSNERDASTSLDAAAADGGVPDGGPSSADSGPDAAMSPDAMSPTDGGVSSDGGGPDASTPSCPDVCFSWLPATNRCVSTPDVIATDCNPGLASEGRCPSGFACGAERSFTLGTYDYTLPICEPSSSAPYQLDIDLTPAPSPAGTPVTVTFEFQMNGGAWPSSGVPGSAGTITLTRKDTSAQEAVADLPTSAPATLQLNVPPGTYYVSVSLPTTVDSTLYPAFGVRTGELEVTAGGTVMIDLEAVAVDFRVLLDGVSINSLDSNVQIWFEGCTALTTFRVLTATEVPEGRIVLAPDTYKVTVFSYGSLDPLVMPVGHVVFDGTVVGTSTTQTLDLNLETHLVQGTLTINGAAPPATSAGGSGSMLFFNSPAATIVPVSDTRPATFSARLFAGSYGVRFASDNVLWPDAPAGWISPTDNYVPPAPMAFNFDTVDVSGVARRSGSPEAYTEIQFYGGDRSATLETDALGQFSATIFSGTYDVTLQGSPAFATPSAPLQRAWVATSTAQDWNVPQRTLSITLTHNGVSPPDAAGPAGTRGAITVTDRSGPSPNSVRVELPSTGPLEAVVSIYDGTWQVAYTRSLHGGYEDLPVTGGLLLGTVALAGANETASFDLQSVQVFGDITLGGGAIPSAQSGLHRGTFTLSPFASTVPSSGSLDLPMSGATSYSFWLFPGIYGSSYSCNEPDCDVTIGTFRFESLLTGLEIQ